MSSHQILQITAVDPFATAISNESTIVASSISQQNVLHMIQNNSSSKINLLATSSFLNNSDGISSGTVELNQTNALDRGFNTDAVVRIFNATSSSLKPEQETIITKTTDGTTMALEVQRIPEEAKVTVTEKDRKNTTSYTTTMFKTLITETTPDIFHTTAANVVMLVEQTTGIPVLHPITTRKFSSIGTDEQSQIVDDGNIVVGMSGKYQTSPVTESPSVTLSEFDIHSSSFQSSADSFVTEPLSIEIKHQSELPKISTTSVELSPTITNEFNTAKSQEQDNEHEDENLFVADKTLFSQDGVMKTDFNGMHSVTGFVTPTEVN
uniref:Protein grainyhead n=1 Tax=Loa loa TaxID=7209 RepID=A0A1I7W0B3_LOALO